MTLSLITTVAAILVALALGEIAAAYFMRD